MIHPNVCFLILLICCWFVTASLMAEKTNVGVAVFVADNTIGKSIPGYKCNECNKQQQIMPAYRMSHKI